MFCRSSGNRAPNPLLFEPPTHSYPSPNRTHKPQVPSANFRFAKPLCAVDAVRQGQLCSTVEEVVQCGKDSKEGKSAKMPCP